MSRRTGRGPDAPPRPSGVGTARTGDDPARVHSAAEPWDGEASWAESWGESWAESWSAPLEVAALIALDPAGFGGVALRASAGPVRDAWLASLRTLLPDVPWRRVPAQVPEARLIGGLDLAASLREGKAIAADGLLAEADGGILLLVMAERATAATVAAITALQDTGVMAVERDGFSSRRPVRVGVIALDEGQGEDERISEPLSDRLAFLLDLEGLPVPGLLEWLKPSGSGEGLEPLVTRHGLARARAEFAGVRVGDEVVEAIVATALALGVASLRPALFAVRAARGLAAIEGVREVSEDHARRAAALVLAPRATAVPTRAPDPDLEPPAPPPEAESPSESGPESIHEADPPPAAAPSDPQSAGPLTDNSRDPKAPGAADSLEDVILAAAQAAIPRGLLAMLTGGTSPRSKAHSVGRTGMLQRSKLRGRPAGVGPGHPGRGMRLDLIETLRAAAPWQKMRARGERLAIRPEDFRIARFVSRAQTTTIFVIDASGSSALHRLAEAKGAVELLLADCYVRRDRVAVLSFRGHAAELLLPPTRSLVRAKRCLARLPGGGGTPLAAGIDAAFVLADQLKRQGETPTVVLLTDGRANVGRDGLPGRERAAEDAQSAARRLRGAAIRALLLDTSPRVQPLAESLAQAMGARYLLLPHANAQHLSMAVRSLLATS